MFNGQLRRVVVSPLAHHSLERALVNSQWSILKDYRMLDKIRVVQPGTEELLDLHHTKDEFKIGTCPSPRPAPGQCS